MVIAAQPSGGSTALLDRHGRHLRKLRISLTEACNLRCVYCMPAHATFAPDDTLLPPDELAGIARALVDLGVDTIRLTGGEPTLRRDFPAIARSLCRLPGVRVGLTTNGWRLAELAPDLAAWGLRGVNVSLDSLDADNFRRMARGGNLGAVLEGIFEAKRRGLSVKINTVVMRSRNDHELEAFHDFSVLHGIEVRFLELMRIGEALPDFEARFVPASEMLARLEKHSPLQDVAVEPDATAFRRISRDGAALGFIASESRPFCTGCSRLRLTARGVLRPCLFKDEGISLRGLSRDGIEEAVREVADLKPIGRLPRLEQAMHAIGG